MDDKIGVLLFLRGGHTVAGMMSPKEVEEFVFWLGKGEEYANLLQLKNEEQGYTYQIPYKGIVCVRYG